MARSHFPDSRSRGRDGDIHATSGSWVTFGQMTEASEEATGTLLPNGKVLVVGGVGTSGSALTSAELYDPGSGT